MSTPPTPRPRLGRGLNALFAGAKAPDAPPSTAAEPTSTAGSSTPLREQLLHVPVSDIDVNPHQPRRTFDEASLQELAASLKTNGLIQPLVVRRSGDRYELIAGERRLRAARLAELPSVPVILRDADRPSQAQWALVENIQREDLNPIDRALAYRDLIAQLGLTQAELGNRLGEQRSSIANFLRLLELEPIVRDWIATGALSLGHAKVLAGLTDKAQQVVLAERCVSQGLSVRDLERSVASTQKNQGPPPTTPPRSAHLAELESRLTQHVGLRVNVQKSAAKGKGKVVIHYANLDQFEDLLRKLGYEAAAD